VRVESDSGYRVGDVAGASLSDPLLDNGLPSDGHLERDLVGGLLTLFDGGDRRASELLKLAHTRLRPGASSVHFVNRVLEIMLVLVD
jgi:hypothetical protein